MKADDDEICKDGERIRVPMTLLDGAQREMAERMKAAMRDDALVVDALGRPAGHAPGFLYPASGTDAARRVELNHAEAVTRRAMMDCNDSSGITRAEYIAQVSNAWRQP